MRGVWRFHSITIANSITAPSTLFMMDGIRFGDSLPSHLVRSHPAHMSTSAIGQKRINGISVEARCKITVQTGLKSDNGKILTARSRQHDLPRKGKCAR